MNKRILIIGGTSEAKALGFFLNEKGVAFTYTLTTKPMKTYPFEYRIGKIVNISQSNETLKVQFEENEALFDLVIDMTHPHALFIAEILNRLPDSANLNKMLWRYQRQSCLNESETVEDYKTLTAKIVEKRAGKILSFMGCNGSEQIARLLDASHYDCRIYLRSIKRPHFFSERVTLIPLKFSPTEMNNQVLLRTTLDEIGPELVLLKDSGKEGGTDVKRTVLVENDVDFLGLRMPQKKTGRIFKDLEELKFSIGVNK